MDVSTESLVEATIILVSEKIYLFVSFSHTAVWTLHKKGEALRKVRKRTLMELVPAAGLKQVQLDARVVATTCEVVRTPNVRYQGKEGMGGRVSERRTVKDIVQNEELFPLQSLAGDTSAQSPGALRDVKTRSVRVTKVQKLEKESEDLERN